MFTTERLPINSVSIKREYLQKSGEIHQNSHAIGCLQKNPRRAKCLTGIYAINLKLKYGADEMRSQVALLTCGARDPASPCSPFARALRSLKLA